MELKDWTIVGFITILLTSLVYFSYTIGKMSERRALTAALVNEISDTYYEGYDNGIKDGKLGCN